MYTSILCMHMLLRMYKSKYVHAGVHACCLNGTEAVFAAYAHIHTFWGLNSSAAIVRVYIQIYVYFLSLF